ncbi:Uncharacterized conserved protein YbjT, contains NAD(P)-binding and DUF2867 domains [Mycolicibacterium rutilum]|uniref:Uncharacterized conserved protein YbjT, contains NAD(P)-binding and DUF2867 domains n=1 Tax=Mycolicibacterium rutilum TaxID=370526 RepID=A0A1H6IZ88_MYCRU|nr:NmrA family NAD(P)-binding protein [Mycolicibacterium rutilum]SEH54576.1 Uncharacterized conserved protein YbjT, contains NAD(P)-binding and DUF2867 domains [Mycolicibacterium rutilum]
MTSDPTNPILVIGATGRHGNTGEYLVGRLRAEGRAVRVLARTRSERTEKLEALGAEVVVGDLFDRASLAAALQEVDLAYFTYPIAAGVVTAAATYAAAVREVGRRPRTVVMSMGPAQPDHPSDLGKAQWLAEQVMEWAGLELLVLRVAALFHENLLVLHSQSIRREHAFRNSFSDVAMPWISGRDAAELGVAALLHPERFETAVVYPRGSQAYSHTAIAAMMSEIAGTPITFEPVTQEHWRQELIDLSQTDGAHVVNPAMAQHISSIGHAVSAGAPAFPADWDALQAVLGRAPVTMRDFLASHRAEWAPADESTTVAAG